MKTTRKLQYKGMQNILEDLNKKWGLDFVSATSGDCCNTCGNLFTPEDDKKWGNANSWLMIKWFFKGMNYHGKLSEFDSLFIKYDLNNVVSMQVVCEDLRNALMGRYEVIDPTDNSQCIELKKIK